MVSPESPDHHQTPSSPRISFSGDFLDDSDFISITPSSPQIPKSPDFEFLSNKSSMSSADELFFQGKLLPFRDTPAPASAPAQEPRIWFVDDDPSPRPPKCTVLWKELLRLRKQKAASLSPSSSTSSSTSSSSSGEHVAGGEVVSSREKHMRRIKKGIERTKSAANIIRIRPMVNVPVCAPTVNKSCSSLPPLFPLKKGRSLER